MSISDYQYELDETGANPDNLVSDEPQVLTAINGQEYNFFIPENAPYFKDSMVIVHVETGTLLVPNKDFLYTHKFSAASQALGVEVYGSVTVLNRELTGNFYLTYQCLGGPFVFDETNLLTTLGNRVKWPDVRTWEDITAIPEHFPPVSHEVHYDDLIGMTEVVTAIYDLSESVKGNGEGNHMHPMDHIHGLTERLAGTPSNDGNRKINVAASGQIVNHVGAIAVRLPEFQLDTKVRLKVIILTDKEPTEYVLSGTVKNKAEAQSGENWFNAVTSFSGYEHTKEVRLSYSPEDVPYVYIGNNDTWVDAKVILSEVLIDGSLPENYTTGWEVYAVNYVSGDAIPAPDIGTQEFEVDSSSIGTLRPWTVWLIDSNAPRERALPDQDVEDGAEIMVRDYSGKCLVNPAIIRGNVHGQNDLRINRNFAHFTMKFSRTLFTWIITEGNAGTRYVGAHGTGNAVAAVSTPVIQGRRLITSPGDIEINDSAREYVITRIGTNDADITLRENCHMGTMVTIDSVWASSGTVNVHAENGLIHNESGDSFSTQSVSGKMEMRLVKTSETDWTITSFIK